MKFALKSMSNGKYVAANLDTKLVALTANRDAVGPWEQYELYIVNEDGSLVLVDLTTPVDPPVPPIDPPPVPVDPSIKDMIDINSITFVNGPDFRQFKLTTKLSELKIADHCYVNFDKEDGPNRWPDNITPGWDGPLQYSMGLVMKIGGMWYGCAPIELWYGLAGSGGPIQSQDIGDGRGQIEANWFYNSSWNPMHTHQPQPGEQLGFFVVAGDARNNFCPVQERSQIVTFNLPNPNELRTFSY